MASRPFTSNPMGRRDITGDELDPNRIRKNQTGRTTYARRNSGLAAPTIQRDYASELIAGNRNRIDVFSNLFIPIPDCQPQQLIFFVRYALSDCFLFLLG